MGWRPSVKAQAQLFARGMALRKRCDLARGCPATDRAQAVYEGNEFNALCKDFQENPGHEMQMGGLCLPHAGI